MDIELLHTTAGDRKKKIDTSTAEGCEQAKELIDRLLRQGTALFLERGAGKRTKTYRVQGYDPQTDRLICRVEAKGALVRASPAKGRVAGVPAIRGGCR
jgi:hypothetical protein